MLEYSLKRLASSVLTLCIIIVVVFVLLRQMPIEGYFDNFDKLDQAQINTQSIPVADGFRYAKIDGKSVLVPDMEKNRQVIADMMTK